MSGYKRVNFYELCRLCASNQQKEKTHIFQEEGRKIQLQNKIQSCLSLTVCENDFLPKVVCSQCLRSLEECYVFRKECVTSETMLSSYFKNFRYTEDFKKSGKVYIKDIAVSKTNPPCVQTVPEPVTSTTASALNTTVLNNINLLQDATKTNANNQIPMYTVQLPTVVQNETKTPSKIDAKGLQNQSQVTYSINPLNLASFKNVARNQQLVNQNSELVNVAQFVDLDSIICQSGMPKMKSNIVRTQRQPKMPQNRAQENDPGVIKIELSEADFNTNQLKFDKLSNIKGSLSNKFTYSIKIDDAKGMGVNQAVILNQLPADNNQQQMDITQNLCNVYSNASLMNQVSNQHLVTQTSNTNGLSQIVQNVDANGRNYASLANSMSVSNANEPVFVNANGMSVVKPNFNESLPASVGYTTPTSDVATTLKIHTCDICRKTFKRREHLYQHVKLHTGFRPFTCENCNKSFMRKEHLLRHMTSHSGQKNFMCDICEKTFSRNDNLLKHKKTHDKQSSFTCEVCQKQFVMKHYFQAHKLTHETDKCSLNQMWGLLKA